MNERARRWAQAFGKASASLRLASLLGMTQDHAPRFLSAKRVLGSLRIMRRSFIGERSMILPPAKTEAFAGSAKVKTDRFAREIGTPAEQHVTAQRRR